MTTSFAACAVAALGFSLLLHPALSQDASEVEIMKALSAQPEQGIKGTGGSKMSSEIDAAFIENIRQKSTVSLSIGDRAQLNLVITKQPKIDLEMDFDYKSDVLRGKSLEVAGRLGRVLSSPSMGSETFVIAGHTDAKGSAETNQALSQRRADAVKRYLVDRHGIAPGRLISVGYGKEHLKNPGNPLGRENRRVQAVNMSAPRTVERR